MSKETDSPVLQDKLTLELRRGILILAALSQLGTPQYGYSLMQHLAEKGLTIDQGTLYPLLRRLEEQELLNSDWHLEESRPRRYYVISEKGAKVLQELSAEWHSLVEVMHNLLSSDR
jgi:DNA-binding PadR family transcriptional regulator